MKKRLLFLGDLHNKFNVINQYLKYYDIKDANIVQVGDFGVGFYSLIKDKRHLQMTQDVLIKRNVCLYVVRGNHDNPNYFENDPFGFNNIKLIKDYSILNLCGKNILCIGGATSLDRNYRTYGSDLWDNEVFPYNVEKLKTIEGVDTLVTHTSHVVPNIIMRNDMLDSFAENDDKLKSDVLLEKFKVKNTLLTLLEKNKITHTYYGHYHTSNSIVDEHGVKHRVLGINELWEEKEDSDIYKISK